MTLNRSESQSATATILSARPATATDLGRGQSRRQGNFQGHLTDSLTGYLP
jgi:hypothetical protein